MAGYIALALICIVIALVVHYAFIDKNCPYKYDLSVCKDCPMSDKCEGVLK
jgi:hypothetical protein